MTAFDRFDRVFADVLADVAQPAYPDYIDDVLERATRGSQRPAWTFPERWLPMRTLTRAIPFAPGVPWRNVGILALLALLLATILAIAIGTAHRPAPPYGPAANGQIAYQLDGDLYLRDLATGQSRPLFTGTTFDVFPFYSRDGTKFAFMRYPPGTEGTQSDPATLVVANADGTGERILAGPGLLDWAAWSPSGREIAVLGREGSEQVLSIVPVDGGQPRVLELGMRIENLLDWRPPNGDELIFRSYSEPPNGFYAIRADGSQPPRRISDPKVGVPLGGYVIPTPDGRSIVYMHMGGPFTLRILDIDTGGERIFGGGLPYLSDDESDGHPVLSADGTRMAFGRYWNGDGVDVNHQTWVASLAGNGADARPIGPVIRSHGGIDPFLVMAAPDGEHVVVHKLETSVTWFADFSGSDVQLVDWGDFFESDWQRIAP